jgi:hypothetical protein
VTDLSLYDLKQDSALEVATGTDTNMNASVSGTINWGDGTTSTATVSNNGGSLQVHSSGTKTYSQEGYYQITVSLSDSAGAKAVGRENGRENGVRSGYVRGRARRRNRLTGN